MAMKPPVMTTSRMKLWVCGNFTSLRSFAVVAAVVVTEPVMRASETYLDAAVAPARRFGGCRIEVAAQALGTNHDLGLDASVDQP
jgi:hypothetical protein